MNSQQRRNTFLLSAVVTLALLFGLWWWNENIRVISQPAGLYQDDAFRSGTNDNMQKRPAFMDQLPPGAGDQAPAEPPPADLQTQPELSNSTELDALEADLEGTQVIEVEVESL